MNKKIKIAVCMSGQIRNVPEVVEINKFRLDEFSSKCNVDIDYFCHFWNQNDKYPYQIDSQLLESYISSLDFIDSDTVDVQNRVMRILEPKKIKYSSYNEMLPQIQNLIYTNKTLFNKDLNRMTDVYINKTYFNQDFNDFYDWGFLHISYCNIIKQLAQFYSFEQIVLLVKEHSMKDENVVYDVIIRLRYDSLIVDRDLESLLSAIYKAVDRNSMIVNDIRRYGNDGYVTFDRQTRVNRNKLTKTTVGEFGIFDIFFLGSTPSIVMLADNLFNNVSNNYFKNFSKLTPFNGEALWFKEIENKGIPCESSIDTSLLIGGLLVRDFKNLTFDEHRILSHDSLEYLGVYSKPKNKYQSMIHIMLHDDKSIIEILTELFYNMHPVLRPKDQ